MPSSPRPAKLISWCAVFIYCGIIFYLSSLSKLPMPLEKYNFDKALHGVEYGILGALLYNAVRSVREMKPVRSVFLIAVLLGSFYGLSDEWHQSFVPGRRSSALDWMTDTFGVMAGAWLMIKIKKEA